MAKTHDWDGIGSVLDLGEELSPGMRSAARPFRVLEFFDEVRRPARAREIYERLGIPQSTVSVLLKAMVAIGYLDFDPDGRTYKPSLRVTLLGSWRDSGRLHAGALMAMIEQLGEATGMSASLSNRSGIYLRYVQTFQNERPGLPRVKLAARRYAAWSTGGIVMLADLTDRQIADIIRRTRAEDEPRAREVDPDRVWAMVARSRADGWFSEVGLVTRNVWSIACVVPASATGYGEPLSLTLANGLAEPHRPAEQVGEAMLAAIRDLGRRDHSLNPSSNPKVRGAPT